VRGLTLGALVAVALVGGSLLTAGESVLLAWSGGEVFGHAWVQWWHGEALPAWPRGTDLARGTDTWPVIDPLTTAIAAALGRLFGWTVAWNLVVLGGVALAFVGGAVLARRCDGDPWVGGTVLALGPIFLGSLASGLTEDAGLGLIALALALLRSPSPRRILAGGALLGLAAWCGLVLAWFGALAAVVVCLPDLRQAERRGPVIGAAALALLLVLPAGLMQGDRLGGEGHRHGTAPELHEPLWQVNPWRQADLASFVVPGRAPLEAEHLLRLHPVYLGWIPLLLALRGGRSRWWALLALGVVTATGARLSLAGEPLGVPGPGGWLLDRLPFGGLVNHHARAMLVGQIALAVLAARGAKAWGRLAGPGVAALVALELVLLSPVGLPLPTTPAAVPAVFTDLPEGRGGVLTVPVAGPGVHFQRPLYEQRAHGRPIPVDPNRPGTPYRAFEAGLRGEAVDPEEARFELRKYGGIELVVARPGHEAAVEALFGPAQRVTETGSVWDLRERAEQF
jgi:hypothetical protein